MVKKIVGLTINLPMATDHYTVGDTAFVEGKFREITEIQDKSVEWETHIDFMYNIYVDGKIYKTIENSPVTVIYSLAVETNA